MRNIVFSESQLKPTSKGDRASWMLANAGLREVRWWNWGRNGMEGGRDPGGFIGLGCIGWAAGGAGGRDEAWHQLERAGIDGWR